MYFKQGRSMWGEGRSPFAKQKRSKYFELGSEAQLMISYGTLAPPPLRSGGGRGKAATRQVCPSHSLATSRQIEKSWRANTGVFQGEPLSGTTTNTLRSSVAVPLSRPLFLKGELREKMSNVSPFNTSK